MPRRSGGSKAATATRISCRRRAVRSPLSMMRSPHASPPGFAGPVRTVERIADDQWTVAGGFDRHRPLWKVALADAAGTELYISSLTGQPVQRTTRGQRFWNWLGSVPHWIYPTLLRRDREAWRQAVMWVAGPCIAVALTGLWIGIWRLRTGRRRYRGGRMTPYRGWMLWHHVSGLAGGVMLTTWIVSGWLSVDPGHAFAGAEAPGAAMREYAGRAGSRAISTGWPGSRRTRAASSGAGTPGSPGSRSTAPRRIRIGWSRRRFPRPMPPIRCAPRCWCRTDGGCAGMAGAARLLLDRCDPLPLWRLRFDDAAATWLYVDPMSGALVERQDRTRRAYRWVYTLLHTWDGRG